MYNTNIERYGDKCSLNNKEISDKRLKTWQEKYGIDVELNAQASGTKEYNKYMFKKFCKIAGLKDEYVEV